MIDKIDIEKLKIIEIKKNMILLFEFLENFNYLILFAENKILMKRMNLK